MLARAPRLPMYPYRKPKPHLLLSHISIPTFAASTSSMRAFVGALFAGGVGALLAAPAHGTPRRGGLGEVDLHVVLKDDDPAAAAIRTSSSMKTASIRGLPLTPQPDPVATLLPPESLLDEFGQAVSLSIQKPSSTNPFNRQRSSTTAAVAPPHSTASSSFVDTGTRPLRWRADGIQSAFVLGCGSDGLIWCPITFLDFLWNIISKVLTWSKARRNKLCSLTLAARTFSLTN